MKKPLGRLAAAVLTGAALTLASAPAAFAQDDPSGTPTTSESAPDTTTSTSDTTTSDTPSPDSGTPAPGTPSSDAPPSAEAPAAATPDDQQVRTTEAQRAPRPDTGPSESDSQDADETSGSSEPGDDYTDNAGHGFVGLGGEGVLVIACAEGPPGALATLGLSVTAGPDQDGADGRYWNYDIRVNEGYTGTTAPFSWTCDGQEGRGEVTFETAQPPTSDTPTSSETPTGSETPSSSQNTATTSATTPGTTTATTPSARSTTRPVVQVRYSPQGGVETGFGGTALFWF